MDELLTGQEHAQYAVYMPVSIYIYLPAAASFDENTLASLSRRAGKAEKGISYTHSRHWPWKHTLRVCGDLTPVISPAPAESVCLSEGKLGRGISG